MYHYGISDLEDLYPVGSGAVKVIFTRLHLLTEKYKEGIGDEDGSIYNAEDDHFDISNDGSNPDITYHTTSDTWEGETTTGYTQGTDAEVWFDVDTGHIGKVHTLLFPGANDTMNYNATMGTETTADDQLRYTDVTDSLYTVNLPHTVLGMIGVKLLQNHTWDSSSGGSFLGKIKKWAEDGGNAAWNYIADTTGISDIVNAVDDWGFIDSEEIENHLSDIKNILRKGKEYLIEILKAQVKILVMPDINFLTNTVDTDYFLNYLDGRTGEEFWFTFKQALVTGMILFALYGVVMMGIAFLGEVVTVVAKAAISAGGWVVIALLACALSFGLTWAILAWQDVKHHSTLIFDAFAFAYKFAKWGYIAGARGSHPDITNELLAEHSNV